MLDYACLRRKACRYQRGSKLWKTCIHQKHFWKWLVGGCIPFILPPGSAPGHRLYKPSKESSIIQSLGTVNFVLFYWKTKWKGERAWPNAPPKYAPARNHWFGNWNFTFMLKNRQREINCFDFFILFSSFLWQSFRFFIYLFEWLFIVNM